VAVSVAARVAGWTGFTAYPALHVSAGLGAWAVAAVLVALVLIAFVDRRGIEP
jgi:hypothetical protein